VPGSISIPTGPQAPLPEGAPGSSPGSQGQPEPEKMTLPQTGPQEPPVK
jgi:hypothetical protein